MKKLVAVLVMSALPLTALAQADKPKAKPAAEAKAKPAAEKVASARKSKRSEDARHCLEKSSNTEIIKCAEAYL